MEEFRRGFTLLQALSNHAKGQRLDASDGLVPVVAVGHDPGQGGDLGQPAAIFLLLDFNRECHESNVPFAPAVEQGAGAGVATAAAGWRVQPPGCEA